MIEYTVGVGGDYADWGSAYNAIVALGLLTDDYDVIQISDLTNSTAFVGYVRPNYRRVRFLCKNSHKGSPLSGYKTNLTQTLSFQIQTYGLLADLPSMAGTIEVGGLNVINQSATNCLVLAGPQIDPAVFGNTPYTFMRIANCLIKGRLNNDAGLTWGSTEHCNYYAKNLKIWNCGSYGFGNNVRSFSIPDPGYYNKFAENITIYNCAKDVLTGVYLQYSTFTEVPSLNMKNVVCFKTAAYRNCWTLTTANNWLATGNCADSDNTLPDTFGSGNVHNIVPTTEFESLDDTNFEFLFLRKGALAASANPDPNKGVAPLRTRFNGDVNYAFPSGMQLYNAGQAPSLMTEDIAGLAYGKYGDYPIGCHNAEVAY